jgi:hypothetical protein
MSMSSDRPAAGRGPSRVRARVLTGASWSVWALWIVCAVFVTAMVIDGVFEVVGGLL